MTLRAIAVAIAAARSSCGLRRRESSRVVERSSLPQGSEAGQARSRRLHDRDRQPLLADAAPAATGSTERSSDGEVQRVDVTVTDQDEDHRRHRGACRPRSRDDAEMARRSRTRSTGTRRTRTGNLWYLGEDTKEYEDGKVVSTEGSWEARRGRRGGRDRRPGASRSRGSTYREEYYAGEAEDAAEVLSVEGKVQVPFGRLPGRDDHAELLDDRADGRGAEVLRAAASARCSSCSSRVAQAGPSSSRYTKG